MKPNKHIERSGQDSTKIFDDRNLIDDYRTLIPLLKKGMTVLDVGCGTGAITKDIAAIIGESGKITGIDNTEDFITSGKESYKSYKNLELIHIDLFTYEPTGKFDLIISARVLQWLNNPKEALIQMKSLLKPNGLISILDYNHKAIVWNPMPPESMQSFYQTFLQWREDAGMNNQMAEDLPELLTEAGFQSVEKINADELYKRENADFKSKAGIWSKVAVSKQMVEEGYLDDVLRLKAIEEYNHWVDNIGIFMEMKLNEVRGKNDASE
ncbi:MAG: class I SAM-dependent methyltransferase [Verrucomicrobia bacterium]|nr:class I SAM-dependent methyltransferase [Cytophagales bacterium]